MPEQAEQRPLSDLPLHDLIACHECDLLMRRPDLDEEQKACCPRCGYELMVHRSKMERRAMALVLTALLLFVPANFLPIMKLNLLGQTTHDTVWTGVVGLYNTGMEAVAVLVFLCSMVIPLIKLLCQLTVLVCIKTRRALGLGLLFYRLYHHLREWGMLEVYLMGILVSIVKLIDLADLHLGIGLVCFIGLLLSQVWLEVTMSPHQVWDALEAEGETHARH
ncbi:paraquat-inducible protein A [Pseudomonas sp. BN415]|uniref:paraquat-inducible protein A n=1 Tax=Pseudomonas sp. BN415 TaxID=2567889 RepID=UPI0024546693|nr:paraquat-inducible protein A [Pseudomonas sp. BN415]MDH4582533.1 paraquat-inducible protein A [Pseudomonas sp. BN415]